LSGVHSQIESVPDDSTVLVLSVGGNDGLQMLGMLQHEGMSVHRVISKIRSIFGEFRVRYEALLDKLLKDKPLPLIICTVYKPHFTDAGMGSMTQLVSVLGVRVLNTVITRIAKKYRLPLIDLCTVFNKTKDYANPIEPSVWGGDKITNNILHVLDTHEFAQPRFVVYNAKEYSADGFPDGAAHCPRAHNDLTVADLKGYPATRSAYNEQFREYNEQLRGTGRGLIREEDSGLSDESCDERMSTNGHA